MVDRIIALIKQKGLSVNAAEKQLGFGNGAIKRFSTSSPSVEKIVALSHFLNASVEYIITGKEKNPSLPDDEQELLSYYKKLPEREQIKLLTRAELLAEQYEEQAKQEITMSTNINVYNIAAGAGVSVPFSEDDNYTVRSFPKTDVPSNGDCGIYISGKSMEPKFPDGCIVWVDRKREVNYGDPIIAIYDGAPYCKIYQPDGLHSINPDYKTIKICEDDNCKIFGKVIGFYVE